MELVMCRSCGEFTPARKDGDTWTPIANECPECEGTEFIHSKTDTVVRADG
jgi:ribosomal protein S27E